MDWRIFFNPFLGVSPNFVVEAISNDGAQKAGRSGFLTFDGFTPKLIAKSTRPETNQDRYLNL